MINVIYAYRRLIIVFSVKTDRYAMFVSQISNHTTLKETAHAKKDGMSPVPVPKYMDVSVHISLIYHRHSQCVCCVNLTSISSMTRLSSRATAMLDMN